MTVLAQYRWGELGNLRDVPPLPWGTAIGRTTSVNRSIIDSLNGSRTVDTIGPAGFSEWELTWPLLTEVQTGAVMAAYLSSQSFYFVDSSHGNHLPASSFLSSNGSQALPIAGRGASGFTNANSVSAGPVFRYTGVTPVEPGQLVYAGAFFRRVVPAIPATVSVFLDFMDVLGAVISGPSFSYALTSSWVEVGFTQTAPAGTAWSRMAITSSATGSVSQPIIRVLGRSTLIASSGYVPPGGSARVIVPDKPDIAVIAPLWRTASMRLLEVT